MKLPFYIIVLVFSITFCLGQESSENNPLLETLSKLKDYESLETAEVMVLGVFHFDEKVLSGSHQTSINHLIDRIAAFGPTKVILEWEPKLTKTANEQYRKYQRGILT